MINSTHGENPRTPLHMTSGLPSFHSTDWRDFADYEQLMLPDRRSYSAGKTPISCCIIPDGGNIFVDGGFSRIRFYMQLLAAPPEYGLYATVPQTSAIGAALAVHERWNSPSRPAPDDSTVVEFPGPAAHHRNL